MSARGVGVAEGQVGELQVDGNKNAYDAEVVIHNDGDEPIVDVSVVLLRANYRRRRRGESIADCMVTTIGSNGEGAKFWLTVLTEINNCGVHDVCIVVCGGLEGVADAISATWHGDELRLVVFPVVLGAGEHLFGQTSVRKPMRLVDTRTIGDGLVFLTYQPVRDA